MFSLFKIYVNRVCNMQQWYRILYFRHYSTIFANFIGALLDADLFSSERIPITHEEHVSVRYEGRGCKGRVCEGRGCEGRGCEGRGCEGRGCEGRGCEGRGCEGRGCEGRGVRVGGVRVGGVRVGV